MVLLILHSTIVVVAVSFCFSDQSFDKEEQKNNQRLASNSPPPRPPLPSEEELAACAPPPRPPLPNFEPNDVENYDQDLPMPQTNQPILVRIKFHHPSSMHIDVSFFWFADGSS